MKATGSPDDSPRAAPGAPKKEMTPKPAIPTSGQTAASFDVRREAVRVLSLADATNGYVDRLLSGALKDSGDTYQHRKFLTEIVKGTTRMRLLLDHYIDSVYSGRFESMEHMVKNLLRTGVYQLLFMDSVPDYAALNESVNLANTLRDRKLGALVNGVLRSISRERKKIESEIESAPTQERIALKFSHPRWLVRRWLERFGEEETESLCAADNTPPTLSVRLNPLKPEHPAFDELLAEGIISVRPSEFLPLYNVIEGGVDTRTWKAIANGELTVQDVSAGIPPRLLAPKPGMTVLDLCAAPGTKTGALAELASDKAVVYAVDIDPYRLSLVQTHIKRLKLKSVSLHQANAATADLPPADAILVDAPCSGTGVLAKRSDLRWKRKPEDIMELAQLQGAILHNASRHLRSEGVLVYSTCTIEPEENWGVVRDFLGKHQEFRVENADRFINPELVDDDGAVVTFPHRHYIDGSFCIRMIKT